MKTEVCGCCELPDGTPLAVFNRPGLPALTYRAGTYASFRAAMIEKLSRQPALAGLRTRDDDDFAITLIDMWATVGDVLTFYQERIANEAFLRTCRLRDSVVRMARLIDYQPRPGVAAGTRLAFLLDRGAALTLPVGLRAQSVPAGEEKPQIYETLESITADARVNQLRVLPAPVATNPLGRGSTAGLLAPGQDGLELSEFLSPGTRIALFTDAGALELLTARELRATEERTELSWNGPIQGSAWDIRSRAYTTDRTFRLFGCNAPAQYIEPVDVAGHTSWFMRSFTSFAFTPSAGTFFLDAKYEGIAVGSRLLISVPGSLNALVTVLAVGQGPATFIAPGATTSPVQDTVTWVQVSNAPAIIADRRSAVIHEIKSPRLRFWGYRYPEKLSGALALVPGRRIDADTIEVGGAIEDGAFTGGVRIDGGTLIVGREVILRDASADSPFAAGIAAVNIIGLDATFAESADDGSTASELELDAAQGMKVMALRSDVLPASFTLTSSTPAINITVGTGPARNVALVGHPASIGAAVNALQAGINAAIPAAPELAGFRVTMAESTLILLPGVASTPISVGPALGDSTTASELKLVTPAAIRVDAYLSGDLSAFPAVSNPHPQLEVTLGPIGPRLLQFPSPPGTIAIACSMLRTALQNADAAPAFRFAVVNNLENRIAIIAGTGGASVREYLAISLTDAPALALAADSVLLLGNVALASHGESVRDEVLGDGDAAVPFQSFELQKAPLTRVSSAAAGGTESTLEVQVSGVAWAEVPSLFGRAPNDLVYTTRLADDGTVRVGFGDGRTGARLPSGRGNVIADYRQGSGLSGRVAANALRTPLDLPTGLKSVSNPLAATGGADPEPIEQARENAPTTVRTFGRAVSLPDFEDLVRSSGEVAKAFATWVWDGESRAVHLTIAAQGGAAFLPEDITRIQASVDAARDPNHALFMDNFVPVPIVVTATLIVEPTRSAKAVAAAAREALLASLSFEVLGFGQPLALSEVVAILQGVVGVVAVDVDLFHFKDRSAAVLAARGASADPAQRSLRIFPARPSAVPYPPVLPAEMASIEAPADDVLIATSGGLPD